MEPFAITLRGDDVYDVRWISEDKLAFNVAMRHRYSRGLYTYKVGAKIAEGINEEDLTDIISVLEADPTRMYIRYLDGADHRQKGLALIDTDRRRTGGMGRQNDEFMLVRWVASPPGEVHDWAADRTGQARIAFTFHREKLRAWIHDADTDPWRELGLDLEENRIQGFTGDGNGLYVLHDDREAATESLRVYDLATQTFGPELFRDPKFGLEDSWVRYSRKEGTAVGITYDADVPVTQWFNERFQQIQAAVDARIPGRVNVLLDWDREEKRFVVGGYSDRHPVAYFLYESAKDALVALPKTAPWIDPAAMRPMRTIRYRSRDGLALQGYLTLPTTASDDTKPPLVVYPHGGPWARDTWRWDPQVQFLASRGYAVFQPNYRGSTGFSGEISERRSEFREMFDDVIDGTDAVVRAGVVDPNRIAIYGGSFGGYLALAGAAFTPDRFKCAVSFAGVFDWEQLVGQDRFRRNTRALRSFHRRYIGDPKADAARFEAMSPIRQAANIRIPLLLAHGTDDRVVEDDQTRRLMRVLKENDIPFETLFFEDEGHGLVDPANQVKFLTRLERFLGQHL
jgi:dipeptidyl aminopeptidase/acylaminoacyl peptidase